MNINLTLLGQAISFAIFVWFCMKYVWPPIMKALEERSSTIADGLAAAEQGKRDLEQAEEKVAKLISDGKDKGQDFIVQAQRRAEEIVEAAKDEAKHEAEKIKLIAEGEIKQERNQARENLRREVAELVISGAEQVLMREIDDKSHHEILEQMSSRL